MAAGTSIMKAMKHFLCTQGLYQIWLHIKVASFLLFAPDPFYISFISKFGNMSQECLGQT